MKKKLPWTVPIVLLSFTISQAQAAVSIFGFSIGEDNATLAAILTAVTQQITILHEISDFSRDVKEDVSFLKGIYSTANDVVNQRWETLTGEFVDELLNADPDIREIYHNTSDIIADRVAKNSKFEQLVNTGLNQLVVEAFGDYPATKRGDHYALSDFRALNLNALADKAQDQMKSKATAKRIEQAISDCKGNLEECQRAGTQMQAQTASTLNDVLHLQAEQAKQQAYESVLKNNERKEEELARQKAAEELSNEFGRLRGKPQSIIIGKQQF